MLYGLFIPIAMPLAFFAMHSRGIVALMTSGNRIRHIVSSQDDAVAGLMITTDRELGILDIVMHNQFTHIFISKSPHL